MSPRSRDELKVENLALPDAYPRDLIALVPLRLPLTFVAVQGLTTNALQDWLARRRVTYRSEGPPRRLHGALVARAGRGIVFIDCDDDAAEQQFTAAHETAHFIEDHVRPRQKALNTFGDLIRPVIDGQRAPTPEESVSSVLNRVPLGIHVHLMARGRTGTICSWDVEQREQRADRLALELLAPAKAARRLLRQSANPVGDPEVAAATLLSQQFDLPLSAARPYASLLLGGRRARPKLSERLLGGSR
jgi:IrrE N-terminal-like domain